MGPGGSQRESKNPVEGGSLETLEGLGISFSRSFQPAALVAHPSGSPYHGHDARFPSRCCSLPGSDPASLGPFLQGIIQAGLTLCPLNVSSSSRLCSGAVRKPSPAVMVLWCVIRICSQEDPLNAWSCGNCDRSLRLSSGHAMGRGQLRLAEMLP